MIATVLLAATALGIVLYGVAGLARDRFVTCAEMLATLPGWQPAVHEWAPDPDLAWARAELARHDALAAHYAALALCVAWPRPALPTRVPQRTLQLAAVPA